MNLPRYLFAGSLSLMLHAAFISAKEQAVIFQTNAGSDSASVSLNLVSNPPPSSNNVVEKNVEPKEETKPPTKPKPKKPVEPKKASLEKPVVENKSSTKPTESTPVEQPEPAEHKTPKGADNDQPASSASQGVSSQPTLIEKPSFMEKPVQPKYPRVAQKRGIEGTALFELWIDEQGKLTQLLLITSSGAKMLDDAARKAIQQWKFTPHAENGQKMPSRVRVPVRFSLD
ncbi:energy transducer TonB [Vibrio vulnificus]|uniref:energy transducer TonB n=1 Tax=Vibrio vulnificus TaxID=672 RepID=UPI0009B62E24|nr:energy transducer TonB [Vibrio vulnificus]EGQ7965980.1 energy transducer TonB [Vibrio vulnificus]EIY8042009.1 energy transducer TonB [Vibrio vulnificus]MCU8458646.1 energy transducer TonB [Vibrio vulnificus]OQK35660.1 periplasmic protein TonB1 [Vibrio vulnificus]RZP81428.1 energy transducer TonB [Vibrio vulnificus]